MTAPVPAPTPKYRSCLTSGSSGRPGDAEDAQLQGQRRVVADQRGQLDQGPLAEHRHRGVVLLVVQVGALRARAGQGPHHRVGDLLLLVGEARIRTGPQRLDLRAGEPGVPPEPLASRTARGPWPRGPPRISRYKSTCSEVISSEERTGRRIGGICPP